MIPDLVAVVLAAGRGVRLRPLTDVRPKPLCPVGDVTLLDAGLARVAPYVDETAVNAHHLAEQVVEHVGERAHVSVERDQLLGTAGALGALGGFIGGRAVLLQNGDAYLTDDLSRLVDGWDGTRARLLVQTLPEEADFGRARYIGAALLPAAVVAGLPAEPAGLYELVLRPAWKAGELDLVELDGVAIDCGTPPDYLRANLHASGGHSVVGPGAQVHGTLIRSVVWPGGYVGPGERLVDSVRVGSTMTVRAT